MIAPLLALAKDPRTEEGLRISIANRIALSERPEALSWIREGRRTSRRRTSPNPELSADRDFDRDGLADNVDANPYVPPRKLTEEEQIAQAAVWFQMKARSGEEKEWVSVTYAGSSPFEVLGIDQTVVPDSLLSIAGHQTAKAEFDKFWDIGFEVMAADNLGDPVYPKVTATSFRLPKNAVQACVSFSTVWAPLAGIGELIRLKKIRGGWYVVGVSREWIS